MWYKYVWIAFMLGCSSATPGCARERFAGRLDDVNDASYGIAEHVTLVMPMYNEAADIATSWPVSSRKPTRTTR